MVFLGIDEADKRRQFKRLLKSYGIDGYYEKYQGDYDFIISTGTLQEKLKHIAIAKEIISFIKGCIYLQWYLEDIFEGKTSKWYIVRTNLKEGGI